MTEEAIPENGAVFDVSEEVLDHIFDGIEWVFLRGTFLQLNISLI